VTIAQNIKQFIRFGVVGTIGAIVDFGSYGVMTRILSWETVYCFGLFGGSSYATTLRGLAQCSTPHYPVVAANMVSVFLAIVSNFTLNKFWTFRDKNTENIAAQGMGYLVMSIIAWILNQVLTGFFASRFTILHEMFGSSVDVAAKVLAVLIVLFFNYSGSKFIIFRKRRSTLS